MPTTIAMTPPIAGAETRLAQQQDAQNRRQRGTRPAGNRVDLGEVAACVATGQEEEVEGVKNPGPDDEDPA